ncbi:YtzI protein [Cytobacillus horneckiae]|uniref:YtzI protein n=1 Tax=Cytobacillus horneckiae TaxID=549687 RepID=UPI003D9A9377
MTYIIVIIISIIIVFTVLILSVMTTSKAYTYKHTIDSIQETAEEKKKAVSADEKQGREN